jgi:alpha-aminoadipic semialdehyde synthase
MDPVLLRSTIARNGQLEPQHKHLSKLVDRPFHKRILLLGSGRVAQPVVDYFASQQGYKIEVASNSLPEAQLMTKSRDNVTARLLDVENPEQLRSLVSGADIVIR